MSSEPAPASSSTTPNSAKPVPKWKQLQLEQQELAAKRKREEAEAKAKKLQELGVVPSSPAASTTSAGSDSPSSVPKWKQIQIENEKLAAQRRLEEKEAKQKVLSPFKMASTPVTPSKPADVAKPATPASNANTSTSTPSTETTSNTTATAAAAVADNTNTNKAASTNGSAAPSGAMTASPRAPAIPQSGDSKPADEPIVFTTRTVESLGSTDNAAKSQPLSGTTQSVDNTGEDEVVEAAMVEVVNMYAGIDDDDGGGNNGNEARESDAASRSSGSASSSGSSGSDSESASGEGGDDADLRRPPKDVSDSGLVPVMPRSACASAAEHVTARDIVQSPSIRLRVGYAETQGVRRSMEDRMTVFGRFLGVDAADYFGIFDGHGGDATAHYVGEQLHHVLYAHIKKLVNVTNDDATLNLALALDDPQGLRKAFTSAFEDLQAQLEAKQPPLAGGAVGVAALVLGDQLFLANCGDARAVLIHADGTPTRLSLDHKPHLPAEKARIEGLGGFVTTHTSRQGVITSRVCGAISVSRAFGDVGLQPYLMATPYVAEPVNVAASGAPNAPVALLLACDGLFDVITDEVAAKIIVENPNPEKAAIKLRNAAYAGGSTDNISVLVVHLPAFVAQHPSKIEAQLARAHA